MNLIDSIRQPITEDLKVFKQYFAKALKTDNPLLADVNKYIVEASGKKLRPILTLLSARLCGNINDSAYYAALAVELLHNASLIHDDVVDDTHERRGRSSINARWTNKVAVLSGDYMLSNSLICGTQAGDLRILESIAKIGMELSDGELLQLTNMQKTEITEVDYFKVIQKKTALLFATCAEVGAISAGVDVIKQKHLYRFGELLGLCFQIKDDIFDYYSNIEIGKPTGNDLQDGKVTLPLIYALQKSNETDRGIVAGIIHAKDFTISNIDYVMQFARNLGGVEYAETKMNEFKKQAINELRIFDDSEFKTALIQCVEFAASRQY